MNIQEQLKIVKEEAYTVSSRPYKNIKDVLISNFYILNATHRPIHAYKIVTKPEITAENDMCIVIKQIYATLKETFDFFVYIGEPVEHRGKKLADRVIYSFNDIISKESIDVTVGCTTVQVCLSKLMKNYILTYDRNKQHYIAVYNNLLKTLISFCDYQILKTPYTYSNEGLFYLSNEVITHPDDVWQVLRDTAKQYSTKEEKESKEEEIKQQTYKRLNSNIRKENDFSTGLDEKDDDDYDRFDDDENEEFKSESNLIENFQILQGAVNISAKKKHTFLIHIRDREDVFRGWEYQLRYLEKGLGVFLRPVVVRRNKVTVHEYCGDLYDCLLYHKNTPIKKIDEMLHGMVVVRINDKDRAYQITRVNREKCPELPDNAGLCEEYEDEYLECIRVDLKEWLGRPVNLTDREERITLKDVSLKEIYQIYHKIFCRENNPEKLLTQNFKLLKTLNYFALKQLNIFDCYETFSTKPWRVMCKFLENPLIDICKKGLNKKREARFLEIDRNIDTEILEYEINFPPPLNYWELYSCEEPTSSFFLSMLDSVCNNKEIKCIELPRIFTVGQIKEFTDLKWDAFLEANEKKLNITDICSLVNLQRREWELKFMDIEKSMSHIDYPKPSVAVAILSFKEEELDKMYMKVCTEGKTIERTIREYFYYKIGVPVVIVKIGSDICDANGTKEDIMRDFRRVYLKMMICSHGCLWTLKELPCADTLTMIGSITVKRNKFGDILIGLVSSFDRHYNKFWTKQTIVSKKFIAENIQIKSKIVAKTKSVDKKGKAKGKKNKKAKVKEVKEESSDDEELTFHKFFEYKITNVFGRALFEFKERVCKLPVNIIMFINEENCYYGSLYEKIFRSVIRKMMCNTNLIVIKSENANLNKNKMFFSFCNTIKDSSGDTYKFQTQMHAPGFCIDRDLVMPINDKLKSKQNKRFHQFYLNPILGDINGKLDSCFIDKYNSDNLRLYKVVQYASELSDQYKFIDSEDIEILVYWLHFLDYTTVLNKNKYRTKIGRDGGSKEGYSYISRHPMVVEYSDALVLAFEAGKFCDNKLKAQVLNKKAYERDMENGAASDEIRQLNTKIRSLSMLLSIY